MKSSTFLSETGTLQNTFRDTVQWHIGVYQRDAAGWTSNSSRQRMSKQQTSFDWKISSSTEKQPPTESCSLLSAACLVRQIAAMLLTPNQHSTKAKIVKGICCQVLREMHWTQKRPKLLTKWMLSNVRCFWVFEPIYVSYCCIHFSAGTSSLPSRAQQWLSEIEAEHWS